MNIKFSQLIIIALATAFPAFLFGQQLGHKCGVTYQDAQEIAKRLKKNKDYIKTHALSRSGAVEYIPVRYILTSESNGDGRAKYYDILRAHCLINEKYEDQDLQFYIKEFEDLPSATIFTNPFTTAGRNQIAGYLSNGMRRNAVNIFIVGNADDGSGGGTTLAYYDPNPTRDCIVTDMDYIDRQNVLPHEIGHFFSLLHPFNGWDNEPWQEAVHGNPAPSIAPGNSHAPPFGSVLTEKMDGTNCESAGDFLCSTPPDYNFGITLPNCSEYNGPAQDPNGVNVEPMEDNIMAYFRNCSDYKFTGEQEDMIFADYQSAERTYVRSTYVPNSSVIVKDPSDQLRTPEPGEDLPYYNDIVFIWDNVPNADFYLIEIATNPSFSTIVHEEIVGWNSALVTLEPNKNYFWRVVPFNETYTCVSTTFTLKSFSTGSITAVRNIEEINAWEVFPNPVKADEGLNLTISADAAFEATISVYSLTGQLVFENNNQFIPSGNSSLPIATAGWQPGMYVVSLKSEKGVSTRRVVVTR